MAWRAGLAYSRAGVRRCQMRRQLFGFLTVLFCLPVGLALALSVGFPQAPWLGPTTFVLSSITVIGGGLSLMVAVEASVRGESIGPATVSESPSTAIPAKDNLSRNSPGANGTGTNSLSQSYRIFIVRQKFRASGKLPQEAHIVLEEKLYILDSVFELR